MTDTSTRPLRVGVVLPTYEGMYGDRTARWSDILTMAQRAEALEFDSVWVFDHLLLPVDQWIEGAEPLGVWEAWSVLTAVAARTSRITLGSLVLCTGFRNPALVAKMADTLDEISGGRLILGLGAGSMPDEMARFGFAAEQRVSRFEEAVHIVTTLLREGEIDFAGRYYHAQSCALRPRGPRGSGPPVLIGARQERMFQIAARYADLWNNAWPGKAARIQPELDRMAAACEAVGRDPATLGRTAGVIIDIEDATPNHDWIWARLLRQGGIEPLTGSVEEIAEALRAFGAVGITHIQAWLNPATLAGVEGFAPVLALLDQ